MAKIDLSPTDHLRFVERTLPYVECIARTNVSEMQKFGAIGHIVKGTLADLKRPLVAQNVPVRPSILPEHDDITIDHLAERQRILRNSDVTPQEQALAMDILERMELEVQACERT